MLLRGFVCVFSVRIPACANGYDLCDAPPSWSDCVLPKPLLARLFQLLDKQLKMYSLTFSKKCTGVLDLDSAVGLHTLERLSLFGQFSCVPVVFFSLSGLLTGALSLLLLCCRWVGWVGLYSQKFVSPPYKWRSLHAGWRTLPSFMCWTFAVSVLHSVISPHLAALCVWSRDGFIGVTLVPFRFSSFCCWLPRERVWPGREQRSGPGKGTPWNLQAAASLETGRCVPFPQDKVLIIMVRSNDRCCAHSLRQQAWRIWAPDAC